MFPNAILHHLPFYDSNQRAIKLDYNSSATNFGFPTSFCFENHWLTEPDFSTMLKANWNTLDANRSPLSSFLNKQTDINHANSLQSSLDTLLLKEEVFWKQRSRVNWLKAGDNNTKYFHNKASMRKRNNFIKAITLEDSTVVTNLKDISDSFVHFYSSLFTSQGSDLNAIDSVLKGTTKHISTNHSDYLAKTFETQEVKRALFQLVGDKAPGPDGLLAFVPSFTKLFKKANRLKTVLEDLIPHNQGAFLHNKIIFDNIIIANEIINSINIRKSDKIWWTALKLDMEKAFDRVEWDFIRVFLSHLCCPNKFVSLILKCISTVTLKLCINNHLSPPFQPSRGIRQGDPLSPYLFLLVAEILSTVIHLKSLDHQFNGISIYRSTPSISHLLFADDSMLFTHVNNVNNNAIKDILATYNKATGQTVNFAKSSILFSPNTSSNDEQNFLTSLQMSDKPLIDKHLGVPQCLSRSKKSSFLFLLQKASSKLSPWNQHLFSKDGSLARLWPIFGGDLQEYKDAQSKVCQSSSQPLHTAAPHHRDPADSVPKNV
uniref:Reverse transcriptase domain-containing protein n=1 Tax=Cannabis sativa TaxID=3483 RepID=A0A803QHY3_CANSA